MRHSVTAVFPLFPEGTSFRNAWILPPSPAPRGSNYLSRNGSLRGSPFRLTNRPHFFPSSVHTAEIRPFLNFRPRNLMRAQWSPHQSLVITPRFFATMDKPAPFFFFFLYTISECRTPPLFPFHLTRRFDHSILLPYIFSFSNKYACLHWFPLGRPHRNCCFSSLPLRRIERSPSYAPSLSRQVGVDVPRKLHPSYPPPPATREAKRAPFSPLHFEGFCRIWPLFCASPLEYFPGILARLFTVVFSVVFSPL